MKIKILNEYMYQAYPIVDDMVEVNEEELLLVGSGKKFDLSTQKIVDDLGYEERHQAMLKQQEITSQIAELKGKLNASDYKALKYLDGEITEQEYASIKAQRQSWRDEINRLEQEIKNA